MSEAAIIGLGLDLAEVERFHDALRRHGESFADRICSSAERVGMGAVEASDLAARFAAKEACLKALGTGWARGLAFRQVEIEETGEGVHAVRLRGAARERARDLGVETVLVTLSRQPGTAGAMVILLGSAPPPPAGG